MNNIALFASGNGSNAENIIRYFSEKPNVAKVLLVITNNANAGVINKAKKLKVPVFVLNNQQFQTSQSVIALLQKNQIDLIILAGFLRKISDEFVHAFPNKIINIHPSLLPNYGGKGMYGGKVHQAVIAAKEKESGISIHYVNEHYDEGQLIFQAKCQIEPNDTAEILANKIHTLEQQHFPQVVEQLLQRLQPTT